MLDPTPVPETFHAVGAEEGDVPDAGVVEASDRGDQVHAVDRFQRRGVALAVLPVEGGVGAGPGGGADRDSALAEAGGDPGAGLAGRAQDQDGRML